MKWGFYYENHKQREKMMNITTGTKIKIEEAVYGGYWKKPKFFGTRTIIGTVTKDSYGNRRGQHTFTVEVEATEGVDCPAVGKKILRKGRTLYKNSEILSQPENHEELAKEKSKRATEAKNAKHWTWIFETEGIGPDKLHKIPQWWWGENPDAKKYVLTNLVDDEVSVCPWASVSDYTCFNCDSTFISRSPECHRCGNTDCEKLNIY